MRLLLDTHALLWFLGEPQKVPPGTVEAIKLAGSEAFVSLASLWEISIKVSLKKLSLSKGFDELFPHTVSTSGLSLLPIELRHISAQLSLPWHHRDPFDRMLIAQAQVEGLQVVTRDRDYRPYSVPILWE